MIDTNVALGQSTSYDDVKSAQVSVNIDALQSDITSLSVFNKTIQITHDKTVFRNSTDYTFVGSTPDLEKNVFITVFGDKTRLEISLPGENYVMSSKGNNHEIRNFNNSAVHIIDNPSEGHANPNWQNIIESLPTQPPNSDTHSNVEIDVIFLYTEAAHDEVGSTNIRLMANQGTDKTNIALESSDVPVVLNNVEISGVGYGSCGKNELSVFYNG